MFDQKSNAPRRYFVDVDGHRVLIGLSPEETAEFELLDGVQGHADVRGMIGEGAASKVTGDTRWLELYLKHDAAWQAWIARSRAEQAANLAFVNYG